MRVVPPFPLTAPCRAAWDCGAGWGLTVGTTPGRYSPTEPVTRGQMATFVARMLRAADAGLAPGEPGRFRDVPPGAPHQENIDALASAGVVGGRSDGTYDPGASVTRAPMATFLVRAYELITGSEMSVARDWFPDDERHTAHETAINKAATAGLSGGRARSEEHTSELQSLMR